MMASDDRLDDRIAQRLDDLRGKALEPTRAIEKEMAKWRRGFNMKLESKRVPMLGRMIILETCPRDLTLKAFGLNVSGWPTAVRGTGEYEQEYVKTPRKGTKRWKSLIAPKSLISYSRPGNWPLPLPRQRRNFGCGQCGRWSAKQSASLTMPFGTSLAAIIIGQWKNSSKNLITVTSWMIYMNMQWQAALTSVSPFVMLCQSGVPERWRHILLTRT